MSQDTSINITIPNALWGGKKIFNYQGAKEPFVGVATDKLKDAPSVNLTLSFLKTSPVFSEVETQPFLSLSEGQGWVNKVRGREISYLPMSEIRKLAKTVRE